jgi:hypothetical protein
VPFYWNSTSYNNYFTDTGTTETINNVISPGNVQVEQTLLASPPAAIPSNDVNKLMPSMASTTASISAPSTANLPRMSSLIPPAVNANARNIYTQLYKMILAQKGK